MSRTIIAEPLTREAFAPFGDVIETAGADSFPINDGKCLRYHDLAKVEAAGPKARVLISLLQAEPYTFPLTLGMVERHPLGSQAFYPLGGRRYLIAVCRDTTEGPGEPHAFVAEGYQGVNYPKGRWHAVLTPINEEQEFLVVDRGGEGDNLEEFRFETPWEIHLPGITL